MTSPNSGDTPADVRMLRQSLANQILSCSTSTPIVTLPNKPLRPLPPRDTVEMLLKDVSDGWDILESESENSPGNRIANSQVQYAKFYSALTGLRDGRDIADDELLAIRNAPTLMNELRCVYNEKAKEAVKGKVDGDLTREQARTWVNYRTDSINIRKHVMPLFIQLATALGTTLIDPIQRSLK